MKKLFILLAIFTTVATIAQSVGINIDNSQPNTSAMLDVSSTSKGFLPPRMTTTQRDAIVTPATGLVIFNTTTDGLEFKSSTDWISLKTSSPTAVSFPTVLIGTQVWMVNNLEVTNYRNGDIIPYVSHNANWQYLTTGAWSYYNNDPSSGYGKLYNWYAVNDPRGLAPSGWHVPTDAEWTTLTNTLGGESFAGPKMRTPGTTRWTSPNSTNNESGFAALPGGYRNNLGQSSAIGTGAMFWSSSPYINPIAGAYYRQITNIAVTGAYGNMKFGLSLRCLKD